MTKKSVFDTFKEKNMFKKSRFDIVKQVYKSMFIAPYQNGLHSAQFIMSYDDLNDIKIDLKDSPINNTVRYALSIIIAITIIELAKGNEVTIIDNYNPEKSYDRIGYIKQIMSRHNSWLTYDKNKFHYVNLFNLKRETYAYQDVINYDGTIIIKKEVGFNDLIDIMRTAKLHYSVCISHSNDTMMTHNI